MTLIQRIEEIFKRLPNTEAEYKRIIIEEAETIDFNQDDNGIRRQITQERAMQIKIQKIQWFLGRIQLSRQTMVEDELENRHRSRFSRVDPILEAEEIAFLDALQRRKIAWNTNKPGESGGVRKRKKGIETLLKLGYSLEEAKKFVEQEED